MHTRMQRTQSCGADSSGPIPGNAEYKPKHAWYIPHRPMQGAGLHRALQECHPSFTNASIFSTMHIQYAALDPNSMDHDAHVTS